MQPTTSAQALGQVQSDESADQDPNTILQQQQSQLGVGAAQQTVSGLRSAINNTTNLLNQVAPSVMGRTANSLVTDAQASKQVSNEQAPISANLTKEGTDYTNSTTDLNNLQQEAQTAATGIYQGQQDKLSYAQNLYNTLFAKEQAASAAQTAASQFAQSEKDKSAALAEQAREANLSSSTSSDSGLGGVLSTLLGGGSTTSSGSTSSGAQAQQRAGGGFNFQNASGQAINAVDYSKAKGIPIITQLQNMAKEGDSGAKTALAYVGNDYGVNEAKLKSLEVSPSQYNSTVNVLKALGFKV